MKIRFHVAVARGLGLQQGLAVVAARQPDVEQFGTGVDQCVERVGADVGLGRGNQADPAAGQGVVIFRRRPLRGGKGADGVGDQGQRRREAVVADGRPGEAEVIAVAEGAGDAQRRRQDFIPISYIS
jgi:hypothetical protein